MAKLMYGVNTTQKVTPIQVRDVIIICFVDAHREILEAPKEFVDMDEKEFEKFKFVDVKERIFSLIKENGGDLESPTKENLIYVVSQLKEFAANFRSMGIIAKHSGEIMELIGLLK